MPLKIVRNDITKMNTEAIVNTANAYVKVGPGCDLAIYNAAGYEKLLSYRKDNIGVIPEGDVFITPGFALKSKYIIHAVSPLFTGESENSNEERILRSCYSKSLELAYSRNILSISFPLISTGSFGCPKEIGLRIAVDEINAFLLDHEMDIYLVLFDDRSTELGKRVYPGLKEYINSVYIDERKKIEYRAAAGYPAPGSGRGADLGKSRSAGHGFGRNIRQSFKDAAAIAPEDYEETMCMGSLPDSTLDERMEHLTDSFSEYLLFLIKSKNMENADVYKRAIVDKKTFSKIKNNKDYHPQKLTALCLCVGAMLNLDETRDLLARAGYALSPCDKTDIIFSYFIEHGYYDMIELDIVLEEYGLPCIIM